MRRKPSVISTADVDLFRAEMGEIRPVVTAAERPSKPRPKPNVRSRDADEAQALWTSQHQPFDADGARAGDTASYRRDGVSERIWRMLRRGHYALADELDLHQMTAAVAEPILREFLNDSRAQGRLCLRIVHGKGLHSKAGVPVLRHMVEGALRRRADVLAYVSAPPAMGGTGALLVLLSRRKTSGPSLRPLPPAD